MIKKILFLLTFLLTTLGGGNVFAADETFSVSGDTGNNTINGTSFVSGNLTISNATASVELTIGGGSNNWTLASDKITGKSYTSPSLTFQANKNGLLVINLTKNSGNVKCLKIKRNGSEQKVKSVDVKSPTIDYDNIDYDNGKLGYKIIPAPCSIVVNIDAEADDSYTIDFEGFNDWSFSSFTFDLETIDNIYSNSYPYTWKFNVEAAKWTKSKSQITDNPNWVVMSSGDEARNRVTTAITVDDIDICYGLTFQADVASANAYSANGGICLDWTYRHLWMNGKLTIPDLKVGMKVTFTSDDNVTATEESTGRVSGSGKEFTVTTAGDVTFSVNTNVQAIAVTKTDIATIGVSGGSATTAVVGSDPMNIIIVFRDGNNKILTMSAEEWASCTLTNSDGAVIEVDKGGHSTSSGGDGRGSITVTPVAAGTSTVTISFSGSDRYNAKEGTITFTINKQTPTVTFATGTDQTIPFTTVSYPNAATATNSKPVSYSSSNTNVATVTDAGVVMFHNSGVTTITASVEGDDYYNAASANYELTVKGTQDPTLTWDLDFSDWRDKTLKYGYNAYCLATATGTNATVQYKSSNTKIATVAVEAHGGQTNACKIMPNGNGEVTITAYVEGSGDVNPAEISFKMTIEGDQVNMDFQPTSGTVKVGNTITPYISVPNIKMADITSVTVTTSDASKATVTAGETTGTSDTYTLTTANGGLTSYTKDNTEYLEHIYATIKGEAVTSDAVTITVTVNSDIYKPTTATYQVTVNNEDLNFNWEAPSQTYTLYTGDYMMIPAITGNANGNWSYSKGSTCESEHAYLYDIKSGTPTWNNRDFKIGEGIPDYRLYEPNSTTVTDKAYIVWVNGQSVHTDVLMIYAKTAGTVKLRAKDPQTGASPVDITINIIDKSTLTLAKDTYVGSMSFPYTWSFVGESSIAAVSPNYWEEHEGYYTCGMSTAFNFDYCDEDGDGDTGEALKGKYFVDETGIMPQFYGMTVEFGNSGDENHPYKAKEDKLRLCKYDSKHPDQPLLQVVGGTHKIALPAPGAGCPSNYKLFVKAKSRKNTAKDAILQAYWSDSKKPYYSFTNNDPIIFSVDVTSGEPVKELWVSDVDIYWIAMSTEAKELSYFAESNPNLTYAAAAYSYNEDLDLSKSNEVNGATAYYASGYKPDYDAQGAYTNEQEQQYAVVMKPLTNLGTYVTAGTGMLLKYDEVGSITADTKIPFYMIANPKNVATYKADPTIDGTTHKNYLVGTGATTPTIGRTTEIGGTTYTNFMMSAAYKYYQDISKPSSVQGDYRFDRNWSFYPVMNSGAVAAQKSYLQIPGDLYVNRNGEIVEMPSSSRRTAGESAEAPASKAALAIVFDDDLSNGQGTTGISTVATETTVDSDAWYTLQGVRVETPTKGGIYIHKGRKIVVK